MRFHVDNDIDGVINGWLCPNNPQAISKVSVSIDGRRVAIVQSNGTVAALREWGWHATGECAFILDEVQVPGITQAERVEVYDVDSNLLIYRRRSKPDLKQGRVILMNPSIDPVVSLQNALFAHYQMSYFSVERLPEETLTNIINGGMMKSLLIAGTIPLVRYEGYLQSNEYSTCILVADAYLELARRILWLRKRASLLALPAQAWQAYAIRSPIAFAESLPLEDLGGLRKAFRNVDQETWNFLSSPLTRAMACNLPDERLESFHPSQALEALSRFQVVGHEAFFDAYATTVFTKLGIEAAPPPPPGPAPEAERLADVLRRTPTARTLIDYDVMLGDAVHDVVAQQWTGV